jgi:hypothetical protein
MHQFADKHAPKRGECNSEIGAVINTCWEWSDKKNPKIADLIAEDLENELNITLKEINSFAYYWKKSTDNSSGRHPTRNVIKNWLVKERGEKVEQKLSDPVCPLGFCSGLGFFEAVRRDDMNGCHIIFACKCKPSGDYATWDTSKYNHDHKIVWGINPERRRGDDS